MQGRPSLRDPGKFEEAFIAAKEAFARRNEASIRDEHNMIGATADLERGRKKHRLERNNSVAKLSAPRAPAFIPRGVVISFDGAADFGIPENTDGSFLDGGKKFGLLAQNTTSKHLLEYGVVCLPCMKLILKLLNSYWTSIPLSASGIGRNSFCPIWRL